MTQEGCEIRLNQFVDKPVTKGYNSLVPLKRGEIVLMGFDGIGSEQKGIRPAVILQNDIGNLNSTTVIVAPLTTKSTKANLPTHVLLNSATTNLKADSIVLVEQVRVMDKSRVIKRVASVPSADMERINQALRISFGLVK